MIDTGFSSLVCPSCKRDLRRNNEYLLCKGCDIAYPIVNGIPHFVKDEIFWSEPGITEKTMKNIMAKLEYNNWKDVLSNHEVESVRKHYFFISNLDRAKWHTILNLHSKSVILDLGAGMGTITHALSRHYKYIFSVEPVEVRCEFMEKRFAQEKIDNVMIIRADSETLPFRDNFFDHILLNGILEWIPYSYKNLNPRKAQLLALRNLNRLLKSNGSISIGIENRLNYAYFLGAPDCHVGIKYVTILPRILANILCKFIIDDVYRPYIYSVWGIKRIVSQAGFKNVNVYSSLPSYNEPEYTIKLDSKSEMFNEYIWQTKNRISLMIKMILSGLDLLKYFGYAFRVVASKKE